MNEIQAVAAGAPEPVVEVLVGTIGLIVIIFVWFAKPPFTAKMGGGAAAAGGH